ncbi:MAG: hypothetical protein GEV12_09245 [Micromonosporaceae bacterium]|nr:hypothetical protein [Micromonosporaceae bacterium]
MTGLKPNARQQQLDDRLLDALGRGDEPPDGADRLVTGLAAWRGDLASQIAPATLDLATVLPAAPVPDRRRFRWRRLVAGAGAALVVAGGGGAATVAAAAGAGPDSPLWPVTRLVFPERAEARMAQLAVEEVVARARQAAVERRYADAGRLLGEAEQLVAQVPAATDRQRLLAEVAQVRALLPAGEPPAGELPPAGERLLPVPEPGIDPAVPELPPAGGPAPDPGTVPDPAPAPEPSPAPDPTDPAPEPEPDPTLPVPPLPSLPSLR